MSSAGCLGCCVRPDSRRCMRLNGQTWTARASWPSLECGSQRSWSSGPSTRRDHPVMRHLDAGLIEITPTSPRTSRADRSTYDQSLPIVLQKPSRPALRVPRATRSLVRQSASCKGSSSAAGADIAAPHEISPGGDLRHIASLDTQRPGMARPASQRACETHESAQQGRARLDEDFKASDVERPVIARHSGRDGVTRVVKHRDGQVTQPESARGEEQMTICAARHRTEISVVRSPTHAPILQQAQRDSR